MCAQRVLLCFFGNNLDLRTDFFFFSYISWNQIPSFRSNFLQLNSQLLLFHYSKAFFCYLLSCMCTLEMFSGPDRVTLFFVIGIINTGVVKISLNGLISHFISLLMPLLLTLLGLKPWAVCWPFHSKLLELYFTVPGRVLQLI